MRLTIDLNTIDMENILVDNRDAGPFSWLVLLINVVAPELVKKHRIKLREHKAEAGKEPVRQFEFERAGEPRVPGAK